MSYRDRRLARAERLREWSEKRERKSAAAFESARRTADGIPFGQPVLVGHHSEKRHRRDLAKIDGGMRAGVEHERKAQSMSSRADEIERQAEHAIYSDDDDAIERLRAKLADLEAQRARMTDANAAYRRTHRAELKAEPSAYQRALMVPHPAYSLQNLGGTIARTRQRIALLSGAGQRQPAPTDTATATARAGLIVRAGMTTPSRPGKKPRPVWTVSGNLATWRALLLRLDGRWYRGAFSFFDDPTDAIERACAEAEDPIANVARALDRDLISRDVGASALPEAGAFRGAEVTSARTGKGMPRHENPIGDVARAIVQAEASAPPLADVPFSLAAPISLRKSKQEGLF